MKTQAGCFWNLLSQQREKPSCSSMCVLSCDRVFEIPRTAAQEASQSMGFPRQECWSGLPFPSPGDLPVPGIQSTVSSQEQDCLEPKPAPCVKHYLHLVALHRTAAQNPKTNKYSRGFPSGSESACSAGDPGSIPGLERSPGEGNGNPLQYSSLENLTDRGARTQLSGQAQYMVKLQAQTSWCRCSWIPETY